MNSETLILKTQLTLINHNFKNLVKIPEILLALNVFLFSAAFSYSQDETDKGAKYLSWGLMQLLPSPVLFQDADEKVARVQFGLRWHITPINISFRANKYISPVQFFVINPVRRFTGSVELFVQPELTTAEFRYSRLGKFGIGAGSRLILPLSGEGQNFSLSLGAKYNYREDLAGDDNSHFGIEAGIYAIYGILGVQFNYNFTNKTRYNIGFYFKYF